MKLKILAITLILALSLCTSNIMPVSANNFVGDYSDKDWFKALISQLIEFPSLFDKTYVEAVRSRGEQPSDAIENKYENGESYYAVPYKCYFFNPGDEMNNILEAYILYTSAPDYSFFMVYKFNETSGKYEFTERIPVTLPTDDSLSMEMQYSFVDASDVFEYAQNVYDDLYKIDREVKTVPETSDNILYYFFVLPVILTVIFFRFNRKKLRCNKKI